MIVPSIQGIEFVAGHSPGAASLAIEPRQSIVLVGPNNSGKSTALREIEEWCWGDRRPKKLLQRVEFQTPASEADVRGVLKPFERRPPLGQHIPKNGIWVGAYRFRGSQALQFAIDFDEIHSEDGEGSLEHLRNELLKLVAVRLDGRTRFALTEPRDAGNLRDQPQNHLWQLFVSDEARRVIRSATREAFGLNFLVDATAMKQFHVRMSDEDPGMTGERTLSEQGAIALMDHAQAIDELGDGVQAFTGLLSAVHSLPHTILLIDEPEAFLHPPLARRLGAHLVHAAESGTLVAATHSADFLLGCLEVAPQTTIVRLTYERGVATARSISGTALSELMTDPLLRSTRSINGLFHRSVVVTESDSDRAFYDEINRRLRDAGRGIDDALFINAQNWQTIGRVAAPLRRLGVPSAMVIDFDVLAETSGWGPLLQALNLSDQQSRHLERLRTAVQGHLKALGADRAYKNAGFAALSGQALTDTTALARYLARFGVFTVPGGQLESWMRYLVPSSVRKSDWIVRMLTALGGTSSEPDYVRPSTGDVWDFLDSIGRWASRPGRQGLGVGT